MSTLAGDRVPRLVAGLAAALLALAPPVRASAPAPEFPSLRPERWVGTPVSLQQLRGRVVLLDVWTFG